MTWQTVLTISAECLVMFLFRKGAVPRGNATKDYIQQMGFKEGQVIFKCPKCCSIKPEVTNRVHSQNNFSNAFLLSFSEHIIAQFAKGALEKWITTVLGSITALENQTRSISSSSL